VCGRGLFLLLIDRAMGKIEKCIRFQWRDGVQYLSALCDGRFDIGAANLVLDIVCKENITCIRYTDLVLHFKVLSYRKI